MYPLTVGDLAAQLERLDPSLPVGVCHLHITATSVAVNLAAGDGAVVATNNNGEPAAVWLTTQPLDDVPELHTSRPRSWVTGRPCGCRAEVDISVPGATNTEMCACHDTERQLITTQ